MKSFFNTLNNHAGKIDPLHNPIEANTRRQLLTELRAKKNELILEEDIFKELATSQELFDSLEMGCFR